MGLLRTSAAEGAFHCRRQKKETAGPVFLPGWRLQGKAEKGN